MPIGLTNKVVNKSTLKQALCLNIYKLIKKKQIQFLCPPRKFKLTILHLQQTSLAIMMTLPNSRVKQGQTDKNCKNNAKKKKLESSSNSSIPARSRYNNS